LSSDGPGDERNFRQSAASLLNDLRQPAITDDGKLLVPARGPDEKSGSLASHPDTFYLYSHGNVTVAQAMPDGSLRMLFDEKVGPRDIFQTRAGTTVVHGFAKGFAIDEGGIHKLKARAEKLAVGGRPRQPGGAQGGVVPANWFFDPPEEVERTGFAGEVGSGRPGEMGGGILWPGRDGSARQ
jgi:hypothetical protein